MLGEVVWYARFPEEHEYANPDDPRQDARAAAEAHRDARALHARQRLDGGQHLPLPAQFVQPLRLLLIPYQGYHMLRLISSIF